MKKRIGVIGCGQWGPNQIRTFYFHPEAEVIRVCDTDQKRLDAIQSTFSHIETSLNADDILLADDIDAIVLTTPVSTHYSLAKKALENDKDVLCEKPLTLKSSESTELAELANQKKLILMVGHVFLFNPGILKLKQILDQKECGDIYYFYATRTNLGPVRNDVNVVYDLASHDISIFNYLLGSLPRVTSAIGKCYLRPEIEDVAFVTLEYPDNILVKIQVSWLDPKKVRQITVVGKNKMVTWDDISSSGPVEIFSKHIESSPYYKGFGEFNLLAKDGEVVIPSVPIQEPLKNQAHHFIQCILKREKPISSAESGVAVVQTLEEINSLLRAQAS